MSVKTTYEFNRFQDELMSIDTRENAIDSIETALTLLDRKDNLKWKWISIAIQHSLYHFSIANLEGSNYKQVISSDYNEDDNVYFKRGDEKWKKSNKVKRGLGYIIEWTTIDGEPPQNEKKVNKNKKAKLISFWTALARVQDPELYMNVYHENCKPLVLSSDDWKNIEYLHEDLRNSFMHFIPISRGANISTIKKSVLVALNCIEHLALNTGQIMYFDDFREGKYNNFSEKRIRNTIKSFRDKLK